MSKKFIYVNGDGDYEESVGAYEQSDFISTSAGAGSAGLPIKLDSNGLIASNMVNESGIDHNNLSNTHNLTTDIDHDSITNTHNLTTDIDHDQLTNFVANEHIDWTGASAGTIDPTNYPSAVLVGGSRAFTGDQSMGGNKLTNIGTDASSITGALDAVNKAYVDAVATGLFPKGNVEVATATYLDNNSTITGTTTYNDALVISATLATTDTLTIDGVTYSSTENGTRVLIKNEGDVGGLGATANGIYTIAISGTSLTLTRSVDQDNNPLSEVLNGVFIPKVLLGTVNAGKPYFISSVGTGADSVHTFGTDNIIWEEFTSPSQLSAGDGIAISANVVSVDLLASAGLKFTTGELGVEPGDFAGEGLVDDGSDNLAVDWSTAFNDSKAVKASDLSSTSNGFGASIIGIEDVGGYTDETDVEGAIQDIFSQLGDSGVGVDYTVGTGGVTVGDMVYISGNDTVVTYDDITTPEVVVGIAQTTEAASGTVTVLANDVILAGVLTGAVAGTKYYWTGSGYTTNLAGFSSGDYIWLGGVSSNATSVHVQTDFLYKKA